MPDLDIAWFVKELDSLGLKLTATRRADGSFGLSKWRAVNYWDNAPQAETLWDQHVGNNAERITAIASFLASKSANPERVDACAGAEIRVPHPPQRTH